MSKRKGKHVHYDIKEEEKNNLSVQQKDDNTLV